jgi:Transposase domain (DUF772)
MGWGVMKQLRLATGGVERGYGRPPVGVERTLRVYFLQQWFNLSDPAVEEARTLIACS